MKNDNDLHDSLAQALQDMKMEQGEEFDPSAINLAELQRRTGISRAKLRRLKSNNFKDMPHALTGRKSVKTVMTFSRNITRNGRLIYASLYGKKVFRLKIPIDKNRP